MTGHGIAGLGHVGLYVEDLDASVAFYRDVLGLVVTDSDLERGLLFLSSQPEREHHELLLAQGRTVGAGERLVQQLSWRCASLRAVLDLHRRFSELDVRIQYTVTHGNAVSVYFFDPDGNRCEVYWPTGLEARQPFLVPIDLRRGEDDIRAEVRRLVEQHGATGIVLPA
jgi:catechol 2,3-dioxygenase-like lactoylglutathione lyase family enzyme